MDIDGAVIVCAAAIAALLYVKSATAGYNSFAMLFVAFVELSGVPVPSTTRSASKASIRVFRRRTRPPCSSSIWRSPWGVASGFLPGAPAAGRFRAFRAARAERWCGHRHIAGDGTDTDGRRKHVRNRQLHPRGRTRDLGAGQGRLSKRRGGVAPVLPPPTSFPMSRWPHFSCFARSKPDSRGDSATGSARSRRSSFSRFL